MSKLSETYINLDGEIQHSPFDSPKIKKKSKNNRPPDWKLIAHLCLESEEYFHECPLCNVPIPGIKRNLRNHLRDDHTQAEVVSHLVSWSNYFDEGEEEAEVEVEFIGGTNLRVYIPGSVLYDRLRKVEKVDPTYENFRNLEKILIRHLADYMSEILKDRKSKLLETDE